MTPKAAFTGHAPYLPPTCHGSVMVLTRLGLSAVYQLADNYGPERPMGPPGPPGPQANVLMANQLQVGLRSLPNYCLAARG